MDIQKKRKVLVIVVVVSLVVGAFMAAGADRASVKEDTQWHKVTSKKDPAFSFYAPNVIRHTVAELTFDKQQLKTASMVSDDEGREYVVSITAFPKELENLRRTEIFNFALKLLMPNEDYVLVQYKTLDERKVFFKGLKNGLIDEAARSSERQADFKIEMKDGGETKQGRMTFNDGFLFLQMVTYTEADFSQDDYDKFIESLKL